MRNKKWNLNPFYSLTLVLTINGPKNKEFPAEAIRKR